MKRAHTALLALLVIAGAAGTVAAVAAELKVELPKETATLKPGPGAEVAGTQCLTCHSADYITTQPRDKNLAFWKAEVEK